MRTCLHYVDKKRCTVLDTSRRFCSIAWPSEWGRVLSRSALGSWHPACASYAAQHQDLPLLASLVGKAPATGAVRAPAARLIVHLLGRERSLPPHAKLNLPAVAWTPQLADRQLQPLAVGHPQVGFAVRHQQPAGQVRAQGHAALMAATQREMPRIEGRTRAYTRTSSGRLPHSG